MEDVPWHIVVIVFILFIGWLRGRIRAVAEARRIQKAAEMARRRQKKDAQGGDYTRDRQPPPRTHQPEPAPQPAPPQPKTFRDLFQEMQQQIEAAQAPPQPAPTPPPVPKSAPGRAEALPVVPKDSPIARKPIGYKPPGKRKRRAGGKAGDTLVGVLKNGSSLRTAIILKEVLDSPKALRP